MSDIKIVWRDLAGSIEFKDADLLADESLYTAVVISLFTDRLAEADDVLPNDTGDRRGWWADAFSDIDADRIGSRLWLLNREKQLQQVVEQARQYAQEALNWLVEDGIAGSVTVLASIVRQGVLGLEITIDRPHGIENYRFEGLWEAL